MNKNIRIKFSLTLIVLSLILTSCVTNVNVKRSSNSSSSSTNTSEPIQSSSVTSSEPTQSSSVASSEPIQSSSATSSKQIQSSSTTVDSNEVQITNDVATMFNNLEGCKLREYIENYQVPENVNSYIDENGISFSTLQSDLGTKKELIPFEGELGGTPYISEGSIKLIGNEWVYCNADDGHVGADLIIKFIISENKEIHYKLCAYDFNDQSTIIISD